MNTQPAPLTLNAQPSRAMYEALWEAWGHMPTQEFANRILVALLDRGYVLARHEATASADADGSEFSREEWERIDAENAELRKELAALRASAASVQADQRAELDRLRERLAEVGRERDALRDALSQVPGSRDVLAGIDAALAANKEGA